VAVGFLPIGVAVHPAGTFVYVTNFADNTVSVIETTSNTVTATVEVGPGPIGVAVHPAGTFVYVTLYGIYPGLDARVSVIETASNTVTATVVVGVGPIGIAVHPAGTFVYVGNQFSETVSVIETASNTVTATVPVGGSPVGVAVHPAGTFVYVANSNSDTVSVIETAANTVTATVPVGSQPQAFGQFVGPAGAAPLDVTIDIKPGSDPNSVSLSDQGLLPVAILGSAGFDVGLIDPATLELGGAELATRGSAKAPKLAYSFEDVNADGFLDAMAFFSVPELVAVGALTETTSALTLTGALYDGTAIQGTDNVHVVP
jgi:YVTN family beta-propeller protein